jgi:hypothetical protein
MTGRQLTFFATTADLNTVLSLLEAAEPLQYTTAGVFDINVLDNYFSHADIPDFGHCVRPSSVGNKRYLVSAQGTKIHVRPVPQHAGGVLYAVDQLVNPDTMIVSPGGRYGQHVILSGRLDTVSHSAAAKKLYSSAARIFRRTFVRHEEFLLGPEAASLWTNGVRLTASASSPVAFDVKQG